MKNKISVQIKPTYLEKTEAWLWEYLRNLQEFEPVVICEETKNLDIFPLNNIVILPKVEFPFKLVSFIARMFLPRNIAIEKSLTTVVKNSKTHLIHAHFGPNGVYALPVAKKLGIPLVTSFYGFDTSILSLAQKMRQYSLPWDQLYWIHAYRSLWKNGDIFTVTCQKMKEDLIRLGAPEEKIKILHLGINLEKYKMAQRKLTKSPTILIANRFVPKKGTEYALRAVAEVLKVFPNVKLKIIGDGPLKEELVNIVLKLGIFRSTEFLGILDYGSYMSQMSQADIFLSPSIKAVGDEEGGINTTVIEAMAIGACVFATEESGSELIYDGKTGFVVSQRDVNELFTKIVSYIESPDVWNAVATNARKHVEAEFDSIKQARKLEEIYKLCIQ